MLLKLGVDISRLERPIRRTLNTIETVFSYTVGAGEPVITSTYEGNHSPSSLHYADLAIDLRLPRDLGKEEHLKLKDKLVRTLGKKYDVVMESTHIHIEYDPK